VFRSPARAAALRIGIVNTKSSARIGAWQPVHSSVKAGRLTVRRQVRAQPSSPAPPLRGSVPRGILHHELDLPERSRPDQARSIGLGIPGDLSERCAVGPRAEPIRRESANRHVVGEDDAKRAVVESIGRGDGPPGPVPGREGETVGRRWDVRARRERCDRRDPSRGR
jgi:hypothetical protein